MFDRTIAIAKKEWIQILRDPRSLFVVIAFPAIMIGLYGYAFNLEVKHLPTAIYDLDQTQTTRDLLARFDESEYFDVKGSVQDSTAMTEALDTGLVKVILVFPRGFSKDLAAGRTAELQTVVDGSDSNTAMLALGYVNAVVSRYSEKLLVKALDRAGVPARSLNPVDARVRAWYNPDLNSRHFIVPGLIAVVLMMLSALLTAMTVVRERERGTMEQLVVSPITSRELIIGKILPYVGIAMADVVFGVAMGQILFGVPLRGSPLAVLVSSLVFLVAALGVGLLISVVAESQQAAMTIAWMLTMLPAVLLSGFVYPIASMPKPVQLITYLIPAKYYMQILRALFLKGVGPAAIYQPLAALALFGVGILTVTVARFRKTL